MHIERVDGRKAILHCDICEGDHMLIAAQGELDEGQAAQEEGRNNYACLTHSTKTHP